MGICTKDLSGIPVMNIGPIVELSIIQMVFWIADRSYPTQLMGWIMPLPGIWILDSFVCYADAFWIADNYWTSKKPTIKSRLFRYKEYLFKSINVRGVNFIRFYNKVSLDAIKLNYFKEGLLMFEYSTTC